MFGGIGHFEWLIILVIVLIIFGAGKLPSVGGNLGKAIKNFRKGVKDDALTGQEAEKIDEAAKAKEETETKV
ncbi:twin-arginine translocation protein, TatA/E family subunit [Desulfarculus baarsii DSM 2075]|uniref:Sec-independent protein translocase protein TatA n=1 Tax=Desulfarculus baarsii (strain ATCC 33931 / DSM 2075 / LMG 7858 / VKM B-1802 / 2st14) TaxID=644282 RepID=E1QKN7_DESB2|nr:twin-arginine translocase TatA/TatE family subunit [Desulfarculus baarsii]ADK86246.1 twin-arginine translocation protein, TatA/E family subunit [Desulfarculus baarsii DSM 2075]